MCPSTTTPTPSHTETEISRFTSPKHQRRRPRVTEFFTFTAKTPIRWQRSGDKRESTSRAHATRTTPSGRALSAIPTGTSSVSEVQSVETIRELSPSRAKITPCPDIGALANPRFFHQVGNVTVKSGRTEFVGDRFMVFALELSAYGDAAADGLRQEHVATHCAQAPAWTGRWRSPCGDQWWLVEAVRIHP